MGGMVRSLINNNNQFLENINQPFYKSLEYVTIKHLCKFINEMFYVKCPKDTVSLFPFVFIFDGWMTANRKPAIGKIWCYREDAFVQK